MDGVTQQRLFRLAPEAIVVQAHFQPGEGWRLSLQVRRGDEGWADVAPGFYSHLTTPELLDVILADLSTQLGL